MTLEARLVRRDSALVLESPTVGLWHARPPAGALIRPGDHIGFIEQLGRFIPLLAPQGALGFVGTDEDPRRVIPVEFGQSLCSLQPPTAVLGPEVATERPRAPTTSLVFRAPLSGRYYDRPSPEAAPFLSVGQTVERGQSVALLEVMKTFNRVVYGGEALPAKARILAVLANNGDDVASGDPLFELAPE